MFIRIKLLNFNSHAHVERDDGEEVKVRFVKGISTHTLTWSVTPLKSDSFPVISHFNSHAHVERDVLASPL